MQYKLKKVLSILAVFVVLIGSLLVPVHAEENEEDVSNKTDAPSEKIATVESPLTLKDDAGDYRIDGETPNDSGKYGDYLVSGPIDENDIVYAIKLVDTYTGIHNHNYVRYKTKTWVLDLFDDDYDPIFRKNDCNVEIEYDDLLKISKQADILFNNLAEAKDDKNVFKLHKPGSGGVRKATLPYGLYLIKVVDENGNNRSIGPAILGVNANEEINNETLNLGGKYQVNTDEVFLKVEELSVRKRFKVEEENPKKVIYSRNYCPNKDQEFMFVIDNIFIPNYATKQIEDKDFIFEVKDMFEEGKFEIKEDIYVSIDEDPSFENHVMNWTKLEKKNLDDYKDYKDFIGNEDSNNKYVYMDKDKGFVYPFNPLKTRENCFGKFMSFKYKVEFIGDDTPPKNYFKAYENKVTTKITQQDYKILEKNTVATAWSGTIPFLKYDYDLYEKNGKSSFEGTKLKGVTFLAKPTIEKLSMTTEPNAVSNDEGIVNIEGVTINFKDTEESLKDFDTSISSGPGIMYFMELQPLKNYARNSTRYKIMTNGYKAGGESLKFIMNVYNLDNLKEPVATITDESAITPSEGFWQFPNSQRAYLPSSGSNTMMILTVIGIALITGAVVISRKKKHQESNN